MKVLRATALIALLLGPAYAQVPQVNLIPDTPSKTPEEREADQARDRAYKESLKKIPDAKASSDPWGTMRSDPPKASVNNAAVNKAAANKATVKPAAKTAAKPRTRTGSTQN
ncbi:MAG: hypothetical protein KGQ48_07405 [Bradyrhizobium sp.]|nr:hypothetical protein [Bradyrhizobium sp.]